MALVVDAMVLMDRRKIGNRLDENASVINEIGRRMARRHGDGVETIVWVAAQPTDDSGVGGGGGNEWGVWVLQFATTVVVVVVFVVGESVPSPPLHLGRVAIVVVVVGDVVVKDVVVVDLKVVGAGVILRPCRGLATVILSRTDTNTQTTKRPKLSNTNTRIYQVLW